ncbi:hypothetical protein JHV675_51050 [Mycobacterium avium subsp. hominissuis]
MVVQPGEVTIVLDGATTTAPYQAGNTLLQTARMAGLRAVCSNVLPAWYGATTTAPYQAGNTLLQTARMAGLRAVCSNVLPAWYGAVVVAPSNTMVTSPGCT